MHKLNLNKLTNHPEIERIQMLNNKVYVELYVEVRQNKTGISADINNVGKDVEIKLSFAALVLSISEHSERFKEGVREGDTVILSKNVDTNPGTRNSPNTNCCFVSYKTEAEHKKYSESIFNGPTAVIDDYEIVGIVKSSETITDELIQSSGIA